MFSMIQVRFPVASFSIVCARTGRSESGNGVFGGRFVEVPVFRFTGRDGEADVVKSVEAVEGGSISIGDEDEDDA